MKRFELIENLIADDLGDWNDTASMNDYLGTMLREGFVGYANQTTEELQTEWNERLACKGETA